jgi:hypothetical protein
MDALGAVQCAEWRFAKRACTIEFWKPCQPLSQVGVVRVAQVLSVLGRPAFII